jgi:hypothetical protein
MPIVKPENMNFSNKNLIMIISGLPGTGKTTLALSAPDVLLIDTDKGMARVSPAHRKDASICTTYEEVLADLKAADGQYKTIVIDTCGKLIDYMKDWVVRHPEMFPKGAKTSGGISLQGFGFVKQEFIRLSDELAQKFNVIYLFHETLTKQDEGVFYELLVEGAARTVVWQPADLGAHLFIMNGKRYLGFTPTEQYTAKAAYGIKGLVEVPELADGQPNDFLTKLFAKVRDNLAKESSELVPQKLAYLKAMAEAKNICECVKAPEDVAEAGNAIKALEHALTSEKEAKDMLKDRLAELGIVWDKAAKVYKYADK